MASTDYRPRFGRDIRIKPDERVRPAKTRCCARPDCEAEGTHKVPKSRENLGEHLWFCLEHARAHNEGWDYFRGMSEDEIEAFRVAALTGHRPTWKLDGRHRARSRPGPDDAERYSDPHGVFGDADEAPRPRAPERRLTGVQLRALELLNLEPGATLHEIKARYKELVKRFHPDANGGDRGAEERLKQVIKAYGVLRAAGLT
jgi:curved DNA-binding protein CbpA